MVVVSKESDGTLVGHATEMAREEEGIRNAYAGLGGGVVVL